MNINVFNDCQNEYLFVDARLLYKICFLNKTSDLLKHILIKYNTNEDAIKNAWNLVLAGRVPSDAKSLAYILILNDLILEAYNHLLLEIRKFEKFRNDDGKPLEAEPLKLAKKNAEDQFFESLKSPRLDASQIRMLDLFLKTYADRFKNNGTNFAETYNNVIRPILRKASAIASEELTYNPLMDCEANNFMSDRFFSFIFEGTYRLSTLRDTNGDVVLRATALTNGETPPAVMSVNTLIFPTTVAPIIAFNSPSNDEPTTMVGLAQNLNQINQLNERIQQNYRVSPLGDMTLEARRDLLRNAMSIVDDAQKNGETSALISTMSARLNSETDALSKNPSSPYFGMAPKDIKAGLLAKLLGGNDGYTNLAVEFDNALIKGVVYIQNQKQNAAFVIAENKLLALASSISDAFLNSADTNIEEATNQINDLISSGSLFFYIDEESLQRRGFSPNFEPIPRENAPQLFASVGVVTTAVGIISILVVFIAASIYLFDRRTQEAAKKELQTLRHILGNMEKEFLNIAATSDFDRAKSMFREDAIRVQAQLTLLNTMATSNSLVKEERDNLISLCKRILKLDADLNESTTKDDFEKRLNVIRSGVKLAEGSIDNAIKIQDKAIEDSKTKDPVGTLLEALTSGIKKGGDLLKYAGYITLGLFSIWGGVKLYRSLKSEED